MGLRSDSRRILRRLGNSCREGRGIELSPPSKPDERVHRSLPWAGHLALWGILLGVVPLARPAAPEPINWQWIGERKPTQKVLVMVRVDPAIGLQDLDILAKAGLNPADRDPAQVIGLREAIFITVLKPFLSGRFPAHYQLRLLPRFVLSGIYRTGFKVEKEGYRGPLTLEVTAPREDFGRELIFLESLVRPSASARIHTDSAGNRWFRVDYPEVRYGQSLKFFFAFKYRVEMAVLFEHDVALIDGPEGGPLPEEVRPFLASGYKIDPWLPEALAWAREGGGGGPDIRRESQRLAKFIQNTIVYDKLKRSRYFGGRAVYSDIDDMYQDPRVTLSRRVGACPDTVLLECALLRARGIACRTAGRAGHFFSMVYVPGRDWMSTSVHPTAIPLIVAPGPDHVPFQKWHPKIPLRTILWEVSSRIEAED